MLFSAISKIKSHQHLIDDNSVEIQRRGPETGRMVKNNNTAIPFYLLYLFMQLQKRTKTFFTVAIAYLVVVLCDCLYAQLHSLCNLSSVCVWFGNGEKTKGPVTAERYETTIIKNNNKNEWTGLSVLQQQKSRGSRSGDNKILLIIARSDLLASLTNSKGATEPGRRPLDLELETRQAETIGVIIMPTVQLRGAPRGDRGTIMKEKEARLLLLLRTLWVVAAIVARTIIVNERRWQSNDDNEFIVNVD